MPSDVPPPFPNQPVPQATVALPLEALPGAVALGRDGIYLAANKFFAGLFGYGDAAELPGRSLLNHLPEPERARVQARCLAWERTGGDPLVFETVGLRRDGSTFPMQVHLAKASLADGPGTLISCADQSERPRLGNEPGEGDAPFRDIVEQSIDIIFELDGQGRFTFVSPAWERHFGFPASEMFGKPFAPYLHPDDVGPCLAYLHRVLETGVGELSPTFQVRRADGSWRSFAANGTARSGPGGERRFLGMGRDVTEWHRAQESIENRIATLTRPLDGKAVFFEELFSLEEFQRIQDEFALATGVASILTRPDGTYLTAPSQVTELCTDIIRKTEKGCRNCFHSDALLGRYHPESPLVQECLSGGLLDAGVDITVGGHHIANWLIGQVRDETQGEANMRAYAREIGADEDAAAAAFLKVPAMSRQRFEQIARFLFSLANRLSTAAYQNVLQARAITERKQSEAALRESENRFRSYLENAPIGIFLFDEKGRYLQVNPAASAITGYSEEELLAMGVADVIAEDWQATCARRFQELVEFGHASVELGFKRKSGRLGHSQVEAVRLSTTRFLGFTSDITERKRGEVSLRESEAQLRIIFEASEAGILLVSPKGEISFANRKMAEMFGLPLDALIGASYIGRLHPSEKAHGDDRMRKLIAGEIQLVSVERRFIRADGTDFWGHLSGRRLEHADGSLRALVGIVTDTTKRRQAEEDQRNLQAQLHQAQKMESLGSLAGGVAHDMNNVLAAILGLASAHIENQLPGSPTQRAFGTIIKAAERGGNLLKSLLSFARQNSAEEQDLDLNAILREEVRLLERTTLSKVRLVLDLTPDLRPIRGDAGALTHAFMNLCVNAVDAMPENGTLTLRTRNLPGDWVEVQFQDTGTGMPKEILEKAMDPFFTTKEVGKGTGLGLSIVYSTVKTYQGEMELLSEPGLGTCVIIRFPVCASPAKPAEPSGTYRTMPAQGSLKVLLVDDDELVQNSMLGMLELLGHQPTLATSGEESLAKLEAGLRPEVVILDMNMPGLGGTGTLPRIRELLPWVPVLLTTGRADQAAQDLVQAYPYVTLLSKPFGMKELQAHLAPFLG